MDELVLRGMARWPQVPDCRGWLGLDARGQWWLRGAQARPWPRQGDGALDKTGASVLHHDGLLGFIGRNYLAGEDGAWYFQNGPQRVWVELEAAPLVLRIDPDGALSTHTGVACAARAAWVDAAGRVWLETDAGPGLVHSADVGRLSDWVDDTATRLALPGGAALELAGLDGEPGATLGFQASPSRP